MTEVGWVSGCIGVGVGYESIYEPQNRVPKSPLHGRININPRPIPPKLPNNVHSVAQSFRDEFPKIQTLGSNGSSEVRLI